MEGIDWLLVFIGLLWTFLIIQIQAMNFSNWSRNRLPLENTGKMLNLAIHLILLSSIWMGILGDGLFININWILIVIALILLVIWMVISHIQRKFLLRKLRAARAELEKAKRQYENTKKEVEEKINGLKHKKN